MSCTIVKILKKDDRRIENYKVIKKTEMTRISGISQNDRRNQVTEKNTVDTVIYSHPYSPNLLV